MFNDDGENDEIRMRWIFRLLHRVLAGIHHICILVFISNCIPSIAFQGNQGRKEFGFTAFTSGWIGLAGRCHCFLYPAAGQPPIWSVDAEMVDIQCGVVLYCN
jgi:hypothetical protein